MSGGLAPVRALALAGTDIFVGGDFTQTAVVSTTHIAQWSTITDTWSALGDGGTNNTVTSLAPISTFALYVGGDFTLAGGSAWTRIARYYSFLKNWVPPGVGMMPGLNGTVRGLVAAPDGATVYALDDFTMASTFTVSHVALLDLASQSWSAMGTGLDPSGYTACSWQ